jgi:hypothetical protein
MFTSDFINTAMPEPQEFYRASRRSGSVDEVNRSDFAKPRKRNLCLSAFFS